MLRYIFFIFIISFCSACLQNQPLKLSYNGNRPKQLSDGWQIATPQGFDADLLQQGYELFFSESRFPMAKSLLVVHNGKLVAEAYCKDTADISRINNIQSCTKSITSILVGIALKNKLINSINTPLYKFYPQHFDNDPKKQKITIRNCLTMRGGLLFDNGTHTEELFRTDENSLSFVLKQDMVNDTGTIFAYNDGLPQLVGGLVSSVSGLSLEQYATKQLFEPLGIKHFVWEKAHDGSNFGAFSLHITARDFAKIAQLCLQQGSWNNQQLFDSTWIRQATAIQSGNHVPYGYYFWILPALDGYMMEGHGGQFAYICPKKQLVVVYTAFPYTSGQLWDNLGELIEPIYRSCP